MREKYNYYQSHRQEVDQILCDGAKKMRMQAQERLNLIKSAIGVI